jgi:Trp operon repressor
MEMTLDEMISAIERLQAVYDLMVDDEQRETKQSLRRAISTLASKAYVAAL